jgi:hypothetical protein
VFIQVGVAEALFRDVVVVPFAAAAITKDTVATRGLDVVYGDALKFVAERYVCACANERTNERTNE